MSSNIGGSLSKGARLSGPKRTQSMAITEHSAVLAENDPWFNPAGHVGRCMDVITWWAMTKTSDRAKY